MSFKKEKRVQWNEELVLSESRGIPQLIKALEILQRDSREDSIETIGSILQTWHLWANKLSPNIEFGKFLCKLQSLHSLKGIKKYLQVERERRNISKDEGTESSVPFNSDVSSETPSTSDYVGGSNSIHVNVVEADNLSDSLSDCFVHLDSSVEIEPTQELDFHIEDYEEDS